MLIRTISLFDTGQIMRRSDASGKRPVEEAERLRARVLKLEYISRAIADNRDSEEQIDEAWLEWERTFDAMKDPIVLLDNQLNIIQANSAAMLFSGKSFEEIVGKQCWKVIHGLDGPPENCPVLRSQKTKRHEQSQFCLTNKNIWIDALADPILDKQGNVIKSIHVVRDITDQKKAEQLIRSEKDRAQKYLDVAGVIIIAIDSEYKVSLINRKGCQILGYEEEEILGKNWIDNFIPIEKRDEIKKILTDLMQGEPDERQRRENPVLTKSGQERLIAWHNTVLKDENGEVISLLSSGEDITEQKMAEDALKESERHYRLLANSITEGLTQIDENGIKLYVNNKYAEIFGYTPEQMIGHHWSEFYDEKAKKVVEKELSHRKKDISKPYELENTTKSGRKIFLRISPQPVFDKAGNYKGSIALINDITERKKVMEAIKSSELRYRELFNHINSGVAVYEVYGEGKDFIFKDFNKAGEQIDKIKKEDLIGKSVTEVFPGVCEFGLFDVFQRVWKTGVPQQHPVSLYKDNRFVGWRENYIYKLPSGEIVAVYNDLTEHMKAQQALDRERHKLREYFENFPALEYNITFDGMIADCNQVTLSTLGYGGKNELIGKPLLTTIYPPSSRQKAQQLMEKWKKEGQLRNEEIQIVTKKGEIIDVLLNVTTIFNHDGKPIHSLSTHTVITERKKAERALREREALLNEVGTITKIGGWEMDLITRKAKWTKGTYDIVEIDYEDLIPGPDEHVQYYLPQYRLLVEEAMKKLIDDDEPLDFEAQLRTAKRNIKWCRAVGRAVRKDGKCIKVYGTFQDITERKNAEAALRRSETLHLSLFESATDAIFFMEDYRFIDCNKATLVIYGCRSRDDIIDHFPWDFSPACQPDGSDSRARAIELIDAALAGKSQRFEWLHNRFDGSVFYAEVSLNRLELDGRKILQAIVRDITERKQIENLAGEREAKLMSIFRASPIAIGLVSNRVLLQVNDKMCEMTGYTEDELVGRDARILYQNDKEYEYVGRVKYEQIHEHGTGTVETKWKCKDDRIIDVILSSTPLDPSDLSKGVTFTALDITDRKLAENALVESEERYRATFEQAIDSVVLVEPETGKIIAFNDNACKVLGYTRREFENLSLTDIEAVESDNEIMRHRKRILESGQDIFETRHRTKDGQIRDVLVSVKVISTRGRKVLQSIFRDITERKKSERMLIQEQARLKALASELTLAEEHERRRVAIRLHDQVGQLLAVSKMKLETILQAQRENKISRDLSEIKLMLGQTITEARNLMFDLSSPVLYDLGFEAAVAEWLGEQVGKKHKIRTNFEDDGQHKPMDEDIRVLLFRNVQELLINVIKHAKAENVEVSIQRTGHRINVSVEDDGIGFRPEEAMLIPSLQRGFGLFSIRQRLEELGGHLKIDSELNKGTKVVMTAPLKKKSEIKEKKS